MASDQSSSPGTGFFSTAPGILTAVAAVITALGGVYGVYVSQHSTPDAGPQTIVTPSPTPTPEPPDPTPAPVPIDDDILNEIALLHDGGSQDSAAATDPLGTWYDAADADSQLVAYSCSLGDTEACSTLESLLVADCQATQDAACDVLYLFEPAGSDLEDLGATCGYLFDDWTYAGVCTT